LGATGAGKSVGVNTLIVFNSSKPDGKIHNGFTGLKRSNSDFTPTFPRHADYHEQSAPRLKWAVSGS